LAICNVALAVNLKKGTFLMFNFDDFHSSRFLGATDLAGVAHVVQIERITSEQLQDGKVKPAIHFVGKQKALLCNKTNWGTLGAAFGKDLNSWIGRSIELFAMPCQGPNGMTQGVRVRAITEPAAALQPQFTAPVAPKQPQF
jgi:hypothetical protein